MTEVEQHIGPFSSPQILPSSIPSSPATISLDTFPLICENPPIRALTAAQYYLIHETYYSTPLPNHILFPWLHG
ncbi:8365_t:CDS:2, partial [Dentiscutata erythropus]